jgi:hypothetical protein
VPEEFADAYREAFERALEDGQHTARAHAAAVEAVEEEAAATGTDLPAIPAAPAPTPVHAGGRITEYRAATPTERVRESALFLPLLVAALALVLIGGAYGVGRMFSDQVDPGAKDTSSKSATNATKDGNGEQGDQGGKDKSGKKQKRWHGKVTPVDIDGVSVSCVLPPSQDAAGRKVSYPPSNMLDGNATTAWRCGGKATGQKLVIDLPKGTDVGQVGLIPGYAKTDPANGVDRYAENNRITRVRWHLGDGVTVTQRLDGGADNRSLQTVRVPRTTTGEITLEILDVVTGSRNTTAISTLRVWAAR